MKVEIYQQIAELINSGNEKGATKLLYSLNKIDLLRIIDWIKDEHDKNRPRLLPQSTIELSSAWNIALLMEKYQVEILAEKFSEILTGWWTENEKETTIKRNRQETDKSICHSHDFCDPNQAMIDALTELGINFDIQEDNFNELLGKAWDLAKQKEFTF